MGSKTKLAERIVALLPRREHLFELFCGGCAISHRAMVVGKYSHIHINDINPLCPQLFYDAITGKYNNEDRWISREDFLRLKDTDGYVASCFSFGNNFQTYAYSPEIEPKKKALHYAVFFGDYSLAEKELGVDLSPLDKCDTREKKYLLAKRLISGRADLSSLERLNSITPPQWEEHKESLYRLINYEQLERIREINGSLDILGLYNRLQRINSIPPPISTRGKRNNTELTISYVDYQSVEIPEKSCIVCDIPYIGTGEYSGKGAGFDHERFYDWAERQTEPLFICSYWMPEERFKIVAEFPRTDTLSRCNNNKKVIERIFMPKDQETKGTIQLSLF